MSRQIIALLCMLFPTYFADHWSYSLPAGLTQCQGHEVRCSLFFFFLFLADLFMAFILRSADYSTTCMCDLVTYVGSTCMCDLVPDVGTTCMCYLVRDVGSTCMCDLVTDAGSTSMCDLIEM